VDFLYFNSILWKTILFWLQNLSPLPFLKVGAWNFIYIIYRLFVRVCREEILEILIVSKMEKDIKISSLQFFSIGLLVVFPKYLCCILKNAGGDRFWKWSKIKEKITEISQFWKKILKKKFSRFFFRYSYTFDEVSFWYTNNCRK